jgi:DNA primase
VTEGALKSLAVERARPELAQAALGGSGLRPLHVAKLATFKLVVVLTDNDEPGVCAGDDMEAALSRHTKTVRVTLPVGKDPDSVPLQELRDALARRV